MILENISSHIIVAGIDYHGKGGVSTVISCQKDMMETFNFLKLQQPGWRKYVLPFVAVLKAFRYLPTRYKIVHIHSASYSDFYRSGIFVLLFKLFRKKVILHIHGAEFEKFLPLRFAHTVCDILHDNLFVGHDLESSLSQLYLPQGRYVGNCIELFRKLPETSESERQCGTSA